MEKVQDQVLEEGDSSLMQKMLNRFNEMQNDEDKEKNHPHENGQKD